MTEKNYNPFKMWGSWVGAVSPSLFFIIAGIEIGRGPLGYAPSGDMAMLGWFALFFLTTLGFLLGWAIHSLIRRFKN